VAQDIEAEELERIDAYWRAANYLSVGQIYLLGNPLLREPLQPEHVKPRLLGHFGTVPGLNLVYAHLNRAIRARNLNAMYVAGPGHGGPGLVRPPDEEDLDGTAGRLVGRQARGDHPGVVEHHQGPRPQEPGEIPESGVGRASVRRVENVESGRIARCDGDRRDALRR
jgi:xylulose-5-phosphate/fructose-6-phosphate phosphoketolase